MPTGATPGFLAFTRAVSVALGRCELTHLPRVPIDVDRARTQHAEYERSLGRLGCLVTCLESSPDMPDSVFIEDTAVVLDELAIIARPGAESRRGETTAVAEALRRHRPVTEIEPPGTLDGGDVLLVGRSIFVGRTARTNAAAIDQMRRIAGPYRYDVRTVAVRHCLHLKSAATTLNDETLLINRQWAPVEEFRGLRLVEVDQDEPAGANIMRVGDELLYAAAFPKTLRRIESRGFSVRTVDVSEIAKAEGAVTCCSLIWPRP